jgi:hypothetical protein
MFLAFLKEDAEKLTDNAANIIDGSIRYAFVKLFE